MVLAARKVLDDCEFGLECLETEDDPRRFRLEWVAALALARAVGHVLHKVDCDENDQLRAIVERKFGEWKKGGGAHRIFTEFVEKERNLILKTYQLSYEDGAVPVVLGRSESAPILVEDVSFGENLFRPLSEGVFAGEDCRDILRKAVAWWRTQLEAIEAEMKK